MSEKQCSKCSATKPIKEFPKKGAVCLECRRAADRKYYTKNKDKVKARAKTYYTTNRDDILANKNRDRLREYNKQYRKQNADKIRKYNKEYKAANRDNIAAWKTIYRRENKDKINEYQRSRINSSPFLKAQKAVRNRLNELIRLRNFEKKFSFYEYIGCSPEEFQAYIESQFTKDMSWGNYGKVWHIDHIIPLGSANSLDQLYELSHYTNLQPLVAADNLSKNDTVPLCWQKFKKDKVALEHNQLDSVPYKMFDIELNLEPLDREHIEFIEKYEWLGTAGFGVKWCFAARAQNVLLGVVMVGEPIKPQFGQHEATIQRGAVSHLAPKNLSSRLVAFSCRYLSRNTNKRIFTAYSDPKAGEIGTIYQACNFDYIGQTFGSSFSFVLPSGKIVSRKYFYSKHYLRKCAKELNLVWDKSWLKDNGFVDFKTIPEEIVTLAKKKLNTLPKVRNKPKHKYVLLINYRPYFLEKTWQPLSYPKR